MNTISGQVLLKESDVGVSGLLVVAYSAPATVPTAPTGAAPAASTITGDRLGSVLTGEDGSFVLNYEDVSFQISDPKLKRPLIHLNVLAPEEPGIAADALLLFSSIVVRQNAGTMEQYIIRLTTAQLQKAGLPIPSERSEDLEPSANIIGRWNLLASQQSGLVDGAIAAAKSVVEAHRTRVSPFNQNFKTVVQSALSKVPASPLSPDRIVGPAESVFTKASAAVVKSVQDTVNSDDPTKRAPARGFITLTSDQVTKLQSQTAADGTIPAPAVAAVSSAASTTTFVQALDRLPLCQPATPNVTCTDSILNPVPPNPANPPAVPGDNVTSITDADIPRYLARLMEPLTAPEEDLVVGLMPVADRDSVEQSIQTFAFDPSPADVPAFYDFNNLQIAFDYVWQEAIDQGALDLAQSAYETILGLGGNPDHPDYKNMHPLAILSAESKLVLNAHATPTVVVRDHRGESPGTRVAPPASGGGVVVGLGSSNDCPYQDAQTVRDHRAGVVNPMTIADPVQRLPALLTALNQRLRENYNFTLFAANTKERSVNFGILNTFRQYWTPLTYQAGKLVKSIPLAPKQSQKVVITRKKFKKRSQKEVENNLKVLKQETSETDRAEEQIANKALNKNSFSMENQAQINYKIYSGTNTTGFKQDAEKSTEDSKKTFHEAVFKASQEFKQEKTTEISTEESSEFESVDTSEISNPNEEITVTFLFYELQRRYRIYERLYRVEPVVLVAQEFPQPGDIDQTWLVRHDWILRRVILDDSFLPVLGTLISSSGDEIALEEMQANVNQQRCIVNELRQELAIASQQATLQRALMDQAVYQKSGSGPSGILGTIEHVAESAVDGVSKYLFGGGSDDNNSNRQALQERADEAADRVRDLMFRMEREVTALNALTESYTKALRDRNTHLADVARLQLHVKDNIMYYMQSIWMHEPADQRYFRLHNTPVPDITNSSRGFHIRFDAPEATLLAPPHQALARFGGRDAKTFPVESVTKFNAQQITYKPLSEVADISTLLGFKGNYAVFPLNQSNALTDFMMDPYVDRATGQLVDPSDPLNWSLDEYSQYVCCLKEKLTADEFQKLLPDLQKLYQIILSNPLRDDDVLVVPTNSLFIEALPGTHTLLERFKLCHRMIDVKAAQSEDREKELDNVRMAARILAGERGDPHIDKKILVEGGANVVIPAGEP